MPKFKPGDVVWRDPELHIRGIDILKIVDVVWHRFKAGNGGQVTRAYQEYITDEYGYYYIQRDGPLRPSDGMWDSEYQKIVRSADEEYLEFNPEFSVYAVGAIDRDYEVTSRLELLIATGKHIE